MKYILITGASSGIGRALATNLSQKFNLILHGRDLKKLKETESLCSSLHGHLIWAMDLKELNKVEVELESFMSDHDIEIIHFIHSAGFMKLIPIKSCSLENINATFATNVFSAALIVKSLIKFKVNSNALKTIVFISSNISNFGAKALSIYGSSKGALDGLMRSLAIELAPRIRVNSVLPGALNTEMSKEIFENEEVLTRMMRDYPLGPGVVNDISDAVDFLISENSRWITGQQIVVDGGRTINITG